jgi:hypothetical protein
VLKKIKRDPEYDWLQWGPCEVCGKHLRVHRTGRIGIHSSKPAKGQTWPG